MNAVITINRGPQFGGRLSVIFLIFAILLFFTGINAIREAHWIIAIPSLLAMAPLLAVFLDVQGVQIDQNQRRIRRYKSFLGIKYGPWKSMEGFDKLLLKWERSAHRTGSAMLAMASMGKHKGQTDDAYCIYLVNAMGDRIEFIDFGTYKAARRFVKKMAVQLQLPFEDTYKRIRDRAYERRLELESRRNK